jgi:lactate dehydrogenase-like 2-hydroxyacid dehydrogenase
MSPISPHERAWLESFFSPEPFDIGRLETAALGLRGGDYCEVHLASETEPAVQSRILVFRRGRIDRALLDRNPELRLVQRLGAGTDGIDLTCAAERGLYVSCLPRRTLAFTAEHAIMLMLALRKRLIAADSAVRAGRFDASAVKPIENVACNWPGLADIGGLYGHTLGIVGLGEVGALVVERARAFGMTIIYSNRTRLPPAREHALSVSYCPLDALLAQSDYVSVHASNIGPNDRLIDRAAFSAMKRTAFLINTSRGRLVDEDALFEALAGGTIAGAGLDVHRVEPRQANDRFAALPNVVMTPHIAGGSRLGLLDEVAATFANMHAALAGEPPPHGRILP